MRKTMMLATALLAACGSVSAPKGDDTGSGSDVGSGSDMMDTSCTTAADCGPGMACATDTHQCVAAAFTLDKAGFYDDGTRWWTSTDAPTLHGTIDDAGGQSLDAFIGGSKVGSATIDGTTWSIELPAGSIKATDTAVTLKLGTLEQNQTFALDNAVPTITLFGSVKDERSDAIDFTSGEPVHTHTGTPIDLTGTGCPAVYKYAYLMDATKPMYGREVSPNPLSWQIKASDATPLDSMDSAYRVRDDAGRVIYDWTSISPDSTGVYAVSLYRNVIPQLGTYSGKLHMEVRFRDAFGNEAVRDTCWDNHPMAAPLDLEDAQSGDLFQYSLLADSPVSYLIAGQGPKVFTQRMIQYGSEPVTISFSMTKPAIQYAATFVDDYAAAAVRAVSLSCPSGIDDPNCAGAPADPPDGSASGTLASPTYEIMLFDDVTSGTPCQMGTNGTLVCTIPGRAQGEQPHSWHFEVRLGYVSVLSPPRPNAIQQIGEFTVGGLTYTGFSDPNPITACSHVVTHVANGTLVYSCSEQTDWARIRALDDARLSIGVFTETFKTSTSPTTAATAPNNIPSSAFTMPAKVWDSGDDNLPGPH